MCKCSKTKVFSTIVIGLFLIAAAAYTISAKLSAPAGSGIAGDVVVATVDGDKVWLSEVMDFYNSNPQLKSIPLEMVYKDILNSLVDAKALSVAALKAGVDKTPEFKRELDKATKQVLSGLYIKAELDKLATEAEIKKLYDEFVKSTPTEEEVEASHILVDSDAKAKEVIAKLKKGEDFSKLAAEYSKDSNGKTGGNLGYFKKAAMVPEFANAAFSMKVGTYSKKPIKTMFGYHIIKVTDRRMSEPPSLEQVKDGLKAKLAEQSFMPVVEAAKKKANVVMTPSAFKNQYIDLSDADANAEAEDAPIAPEDEGMDAAAPTSAPVAAEEEVEEVEVDEVEPENGASPALGAPAATNSAE